jgi:hypothetical protein
VALSIVALVGEHGADARHHREGGQEQPFENERVVGVGLGRGASDRHAVSVDRDVVLGAPLAPVGGVRAGEVAAALGAHGAAVQDQVGMPAQHADQQCVHLRQQAGPCPARQAAAQGRAAGLVFRGGQAAPRRALPQEPAQGGQHPDRRRGRVATPAATQFSAAVDHRRNQA